MIESWLAKSFDAKVDGKRARVVAVEDVSFVANDGRITAMLGPNGAGKTTTLRIIGTLVQVPTAGKRASETLTCKPIHVPCVRSSACCPTRVGYTPA